MRAGTKIPHQYHIQTKNPTLLPKKISKKKLGYRIHTKPNMNGSLNALGHFEKKNGGLKEEALINPFLHWCFETGQHKMVSLPLLNGCTAQTMSTCTAPPSILCCTAASRQPSTFLRQVLTLVIQSKTN